MKVVIIGSKNHGTKNDPVVLRDSLNEGSLTATVLYWEDLVFTIKTNDVRVTCQGQDVFAGPIDLLIGVGWYKKALKDVAYALGLVAKAKDVAIWNSEVTQQRSTTKLSCLVQLALSGVEITESTYSLSSTTHIHAMALPFIAKSPTASRGRSNYLVSTEEARAQIVKSNDEHPYLIQPFLPNDHDLRILCFAGEPKLVLKRMRTEAAESHLNNTSQGGLSEWVSLQSVPSELLTICRKICKITGRELAGIDFIPDAQSPYGYSCLEVNALPQLTSGTDVKKKMTVLHDTIVALKERSRQ